MAILDAVARRAPPPQRVGGGAGSEGARAHARRAKCPLAGRHRDGETGRTHLGRLLGDKVRVECLCLGLVLVDVLVDLGGGGGRFAGKLVVGWRDEAGGGRRRRSRRELRRRCGRSHGGMAIGQGRGRRLEAGSKARRVLGLGEVAMDGRAGEGWEEERIEAGFPG